MMTSPLERAVHHVHVGLLWGASLLVPASQRSEWSQEWRTELWYVLRECCSKTSAHPRSIRQATAFCMGSYQDAICLRKRSWQEQPPFGRIRGSAFGCLLLLIGIFFSAWGIARISHRVAAGISRIQVYPWLASDKGVGPCDCPADLITAGRSLQVTQMLFDGFSHYRITRQAVWAHDMPMTEWTVAQARSDFFAVLHLPVRFKERFPRAPNRLPQIVLSGDTWMRDFGGNPNMAGAEVHVGSIDAIIAGVAFGGSTVLPGGANAWLLDSDSQVGNDKSEFVVGHLSPVGYFDDGRWGLSVGGILLAFLVLPFVSRLSIGEYGSGSHKPSLARRSRFWAFLFAKITILPAIVYYTSVDLGCLLVQPFSPSSDYIQAASAVALCLLGLGWAFRDQQRRCPICLRRMAHPVEVGQPSQTFLGWNGTELVCERGHTLLHIPEIPTSWFDTQRWVCLDGSWQFLFARPNG
jgi:hypothetical protein